VYVFVWREALWISSGHDSGQISEAAAASPVSSVRVELLFLDFLCQLECPEIVTLRRLESVEPEHRPDPLLYSP
jgi:hypothetical protein